MILPIVKFGQPVLRTKGARIDKITSEIQALVQDMFETMYEAPGIGLAAQQVGFPLQLAVIDVTGVTDRPSTLEVDGQPAAPESAMPLVLINPEIKPVGDVVLGPEGCLSFPEIYADIPRPGFVEIEAQNLQGERYRFTAGGLLARAIQHEVDHLNGILFIDRMTNAKRTELRDEIETIQSETRAETKRKKR